MFRILYVPVPLRDFVNLGCRSLFFFLSFLGGVGVGLVYATLKISCVADLKKRVDQK